MDNPFSLAFGGISALVQFPKRMISDSLSWWQGNGMPLDQATREANQAADIFRAGGSAADAAASVEEMRRAAPRGSDWQGPVLMVALIVAGGYVLGQVARKVL